jgi:hypothetical protein
MAGQAAFGPELKIYWHIIKFRGLFLFLATEIGGPAVLKW